MEIELQNATIGYENVIIGSLKRHYRAPEFFFFFLKLDFEKVEFQKIGISLISLEKKDRMLFILPEKGRGQFFPGYWPQNAPLGIILTFTVK